MKTEDCVVQERERIVAFLEAVYASSTHGASGLMARAIEAVRVNMMSDPVAVAAPSEPS